jgi:CubicO group peptidase (beta-lactamase class C family)
MKNSKIVALTLAMLFLSAEGYADSNAAKDASELDRNVASAMARWQVPGLAVVVVKDGQTVLMRGYGTRQYGSELEIDKDTYLQIASNSKAFAAYSIGMLVDEGKLKWDDPVKKHIPELSLPDPFVEETVSIDDLLSHRSGLTENALGGFQDADFKIDDLLGELESTPLSARFRAENNYSQVGMALLGEIVRRVSGKTWGEFVRARIFEPIGMSSSYTSTTDFEARVGSPTEAGNIMIPAVMTNGQVANGSWGNIGTAPLYAPAGGIISNPSDMSAWIRFRLNDGVVNSDRLISAKALGEIRATRIPMNMNNIGIPLSYVHPKAQLIDVGFGHYSFEHRDRKAIIHNGGWMTSVVAIIPEADIGVGIFSNSWFDEPTDWASLAFVNALALDILDHYLDFESEDWVGQMRTIVVGQTEDLRNETSDPSNHQ